MTDLTFISFLGSLYGTVISSLDKTIRGNLVLRRLYFRSYNVE